MYKNELDRACFTHNAAHTNSKNLANWTISDKVLKDRAYEITLNSKYDGCQRELLSMVNKLFEKKKKNRIRRKNECKNAYTRFSIKNVFYKRTSLKKPQTLKKNVTKTSSLWKKMPERFKSYKIE